MELPHSHSFGTQDRKLTNDFLSLYSPAQQDPTLSPPGGYLKTQNFLQPLEQGVGKNVSSTSHISYINQSKKLPNPEGVMMTAAQSSSMDRNDENPNCSSYTGSGFTLWEESAGNKGKTGKENIASIRHVIRSEEGIKIGEAPWPSQSSIHSHQSTSIATLPSSDLSSAQRNQSFVYMLNSGKTCQENEDDADEQEFAIKKEPSPHYHGVLPVKVEAVNHDQKPNTPRSKHSATEQRRRSKINDRISMLREVIPDGDQKRDKASFLLEVIEYIRFLQEKVNKYEDLHQGRNTDQPNMIPWSRSHRPREGFTDQPRDANSVSGSAVVFSTKLNDNNSSIATNIPKTGQNLVTSLDRLPKTASSFAAALQPTFCAPSCGNTVPQTLSELCQKRSFETAENGTVGISSMYSKGLLSTLTEALQRSGVAVSQASISVQIDLGKKENPSILNSSTPIFKKTEVPSMSQALAHCTQEEESGKAFKRFKTSRKG